VTTAQIAPLLGLSRGAPVLVGVIFVVSGPMVVGPLTGSGRPAERLQRIDPVGRALGAPSNMRGFDIRARRPFFETLVQLIISVLFISISATVTPQSLGRLILPAPPWVPGPAAPAAS
jgi:hypothetical protein